MSYLFVYGTLRQDIAHPASLLLSSARFIGRGHIQGKLYEIDGYPGFIDGDGKVYGELYAIDKELLKVVDIYEECAPCFLEPYEYRRVQREVILENGEKFLAWTYLYCGDKKKEFIVSGDYKEYLDTIKEKKEEQMAKVLVPLADGFEEIEAMSIIDVLSRAGNEVVVAGVFDNEVEGANTGLKVLVHTLLKDVDPEDFDIMVLPGGLPGAEHLAKSELVQEYIRRMNEKGKLLGAICAAPWALKEAGVLEGKKHTNYPGFEEKTGKEGYVEDQKVVIDGNVVTSRGPGTAICFALELVKILNGVDKYIELKRGLLADYC